MRNNNDNLINWISIIKATFTHQAVEIARLKDILGWFKRQLIGRRPEQWLVDNLGPYYSSQKTNRYASTNYGRRYFDRTVLQHIIDVLAPEAQGSGPLILKLWIENSPSAERIKIVIYGQKNGQAN